MGLNTDNIKNWIRCDSNTKNQAQFTRSDFENKKSVPSLYLVLPKLHFWQVDSSKERKSFRSKTKRTYRIAFFIDINFNPWTSNKYIIILDLFTVLTVNDDN